MNANEIGKRLGIGVRVAGRLAQQQAQQHAQQRAGAPAPQGQPAGSPSQASPPQTPQLVPDAGQVRQAQQKAGQKVGQVARAAGKGAGGFLRPFTRVGGILWLEVTGFFFGLFALFFGLDLWRARLGYASGPLHQRFLIAAVLTAVFGYLSVSAFWRAKRK